MSCNSITEMSYPDFVAFIGQENCPPGGKETIKRWCEWGKINTESYVLDLACSTGFSSRNAFSLTECQSVGVDVSELAIEQAMKKRDPRADLKVDFKVANACNLPFKKEIFSHVFGGCNFGFIQERATALKEVSRVLKPKGILCIATHYFVKSPPEGLLKDVASKIGFMPEVSWTKEYWDNFFSTEFHPMNFYNYSLPVLEENALKQSIERFCDKSLNHLSSLDRQGCFERLFATRSVLNRFRNYQQCAVSLWEKK